MAVDSGILRVIDTSSDVELAGRCAAGDREAQRALFEKLRRPLHATLYRVMGTNAQMEDLLQDAFLEIFRSLRSYRGEASLATWADRIAARVAYRYLSSREPVPTASDMLPSLQVVEDLCEHEMQVREAGRRLYALLARLAPKYRVAFALHVIDGRPLREVARVTGVSLIAAKNRVWRARRQVDRLARKDRVLVELLQNGENRR